MANLALPHLFVKSNSSLFESTIFIEEIIDFHLVNKHKYAIITESQRICHFPSFHYAAKEKNLIPVLSFHYVWRGLSEWLLIPKNFEGYQFLLKFSLDNFSEESKWKNIVKIFISGDQSNTPWEDQSFFIANAEGERGILIRENLFLNKEDYSLLALLRAIRFQTSYQEELALNSHLKGCYLMQQDYDNKIWKKNLVNILRECDFYSLNYFEKIKTKEIYEIKEREEIINYCKKKLMKMISNIQENLSQKYLERLQQEINLFDAKKYWNYCFIFYELMKFIRQEKILTSAGRGSACSSLIIFLLGITQVDPIKYDLLFDRFLNDSSERIPDLDLDVESSRKLEILEFLENNFGKERFVIPSIIKKVKNLSTLDPILDKILTKEEQKDKSLLNKLIGIPFISQPHPSSLIVLPKHITASYLGAKKEQNFIFPLSPFDYKIVNYLGLQKFDLLSSPYLACISSLLTRIREIKSQNIQLADIPLNNSKTYAMIGKSLTYELFHLDSAAIKKVLVHFKPQSIEELAQLISIIRPGINKHIFKFLNYSKLPHKIEKDILLKKIVEPTRGIILYQEQIMQLISVYINISLTESDKYRIALQKQKIKELERLKLEFFHLAIKQGKPQLQIEKVWNFITSFGAYSFNKSHAIAYALFAYQAAYLKANFKELFYLEMIKKDGFSNIILSELITLGYRIMIPKKLEDWTLEGCFDRNQKIFFIGLNCLKINSTIIFKKLQDIKLKIPEKEMKDLSAVLFFLLSNGFNKEEIVSLNYLDAFQGYFSANQSSLYLNFNWEYLFEKLIYSFSATKVEKISFSDEEKRKYYMERQKNSNIDLSKIELN